MHRCDHCQGLWIDGEDLVWVFPALAHHGRRIGELLARGARRETSVARCALGHEDALEFPFFDLWLDLCERCHGLWLDGTEVSFVERVAQESDGLPDLRKRGTAYRASEASPERVECQACHEQVHPRRTYLSAEGAICDACVEIERMADALEDERAENELKRAPRRLLRLLGDMLDERGKALKKSGFLNWG